VLAQGVDELAQVLALDDPHGQALQEDQISQSIMHALVVSALESPSNLQHITARSTQQHKRQ
jgi:hypothetical protein